MVKVRNPRTRASVRSGLRPHGWRFVLTLLALASFACQTYLFQTHIHFAPETEAQLAGHPIGHDRSPGSGDPANCPICQEILHSGQFVTPAAQVLLSPLAAVSTIVLVDAALPFVGALSHDWRGRAPPRI
jgi:hypothetical protein